MASHSRLYAVGAALVDIIASIPEDFLENHELNRGEMHLSSLKEAQSLYEDLGSSKEVAGGSSANTAAIAANLGMSVSFLGKTANDQLGAIFRHDMAAQGIEVYECIEESGIETGRCLSMVERDGQRTMSTYLGASQCLSDKDVARYSFEEAGVDDWLFLESYMLDTENGRKAIGYLLDVFEGKIALTLSAPACVDRHRSLIHTMLPKLNLVFGNETEVSAVFETDFRRGIEKIGALSGLVVCTHGPEGVFSYEGMKILHQPAQKVEVVDTTGAGDSFAGTVLWGLSKGMTLSQACGYGLKSAAQIIGQVGARPMGKLSDGF